MPLNHCTCTEDETECNGRCNICKVKITLDMESYNDHLCPADCTEVIRRMDKDLCTRCGKPLLVTLTLFGKASNADQPTLYHNYCKAYVGYPGKLGVSE